MKHLLSESKPDTPPNISASSSMSPTSPTSSSISSNPAFTATIPLNAKLAFYLNTLNLNDKDATSNNDREILIHLDELVSQAGLDYKAELVRTLSLFSRPSIGSMAPMSGSFYFHDVESQWQLLMPDNSSNMDGTFIDLTNQCDKEFDEEIMKTYHRNNQVNNSSSISN